jgi:glutathione S-transferase
VIAEGLARRQGLVLAAPGAGDPVLDLWDGAYAVLHSGTKAARNAALKVFTARLDLLDAHLAQIPFLGGATPGAADARLAAFLLTYDFGFRAGFPPASGAAPHWPRLFASARRTLDRAGRLDLVPADGPGPWGPLRPVEIAPSLAAAWREPVPAGGPVERATPAGAEPTPHSGDWPAAAPLHRQRLERVLAAVPAPLPGEPAAGRELRADLYAAAAQLAEGQDAITQQALRRVFWARLSWLEHRLGAEPWASGAERGALDLVLAPLLDHFDAVHQVFPPVDPGLADYPRLAQLRTRLDPTKPERTQP